MCSTIKQLLLDKLNVFRFFLKPLINVFSKLKSFGISGKAQMGAAPNIAGDGQREDRSKLKTITEYKAIGELASLGKDKTMYRDWNIKLKDALG